MSSATQAHLDVALVYRLDVKFVVPGVVDGVQLVLGPAAEQPRHGAARDAHADGERLAVHRAGDQRRPEAVRDL
eukprot:4733500-Pyramimonas_sp.AAC.1